MTGIALLLVIPMIVLNPPGRSAFLGYYTGVVATWIAYAIALRRGRSPKDHRSAAFELIYLTAAHSAEGSDYLAALEKGEPF